MSEVLVGKLSVHTELFSRESYHYLLGKYRTVIFIVTWLGISNVVQTPHQENYR